jgi:hypothetical protein
LLSPQSHRGRREEQFLLSGERTESKKSLFHLPPSRRQMKTLSHVLCVSNESRLGRDEWAVNKVFMM